MEAEEEWQSEDREIIASLRKRRKGSEDDDDDDYADALEERQDERRSSARKRVSRDRRFVWPKRRLASTALKSRDLEDDLLPPPLNARPSLVSSHMGAAVMGRSAHPTAHLFQDLDKDSCFAAFEEMLKKLWPSHVPMPDSLSKRLLFETAIRNCSKLIERNMVARENPKRAAREWVEGLPVDLIEEVKRMPPNELLQRIFGTQF
jgi:hypothetical protein